VGQAFSLRRASARLAPLTIGTWRRYSCWRLAFAGHASACPVRVFLRLRIPQVSCRQARPALAVCGMQSAALCGRQSCLQAAFQAAVQRTTHAVRTHFSGFVSRKHRAAKPEKFVAYRGGFCSFVGQPILAAAGFQPACSTPDEFLGLRCGTLEAHKAKEIPSSETAGRSRFEKPPERRLQAGLPAPLGFSITWMNGQSRGGGLKGRLQARLPATRKAKLPRKVSTTR